MGSDLLKKIKKLSDSCSGKRSAEDDNDVNVKKKKGRETQNFDGDYYFDFKNCLRYVYPYDFQFQAHSKKRWYGREIGEVYDREFRVHSPNTLNYMFKSGKIKVNDKIVEPTYKIKNNDRIASFVHRHENPVFLSKIEIIKDSDDILVINKPSSIPIHTAGKFRLNTILGILSNEYSYKNLFTIHRLDRLTSGVLIFAKNSNKARELSQIIQSRNIEKEYICKVEGEFPDHEIICTEKLDVLDQKLGFRFVNDKGKECLTKFKRLYTDGKSSIVHCKLGTGRTHQIRVHLQFLGYPICNDPFYNSYVFGPNKGKGAEYLKLKSTQELIKDIYDEHPNNKLHGNDIEFELECQNLEQNLSQDNFYDDIDLKLAEESRFELIKNKLFEKHINELETTDEQIDKYINDLVQCNMFNFKTDLAYLRENKHMKFDRNKFNVNPTCELCHMSHKPPKMDELILYLHALRYTINNEIFFAEPPSWAQFSNEFDYSNSFFK